MYAETIKSVRKREGLTMKEFGEKLGVSKQTVFNWERAAYKPNDEVRLKLHTEFNVPYDIYY